MIIQENVQEEGIQVTIAQSQTTEDWMNTLDNGYHLYLKKMVKELRDIWYQNQDRPTTYESENFGTKFSLRGGDYNIPGLEVIK
jgi:hypothetical protein